MIQYIAVHEDRDMLVVLCYNIAYDSDCQFSDCLILCHDCFNYMQLESFFTYYGLGDFLFNCECEFEQCFEGKLLVAGNKWEEPSKRNFVIIDMIDKNPQLSGIFTHNI